MNAVSIGLILLALPAQVNLSSAGPPPSNGCNSVESRQFDFWIGRWDVYPKAQPRRKVADSLIEKLYAGCAIRENWMPRGGGDGGSLNAYLPADSMWHQTWIDSAGSLVEFKGQWNGHSMVMEGVWPQPGHPEQRTRMSYTPFSKDEVEQAGQTSDDGGKTWQPSFDLIYRAAPKQEVQR